VAVFATARKIAQYIYRPVRWQQPYVDAGAATYERRDQAARVNRLAETAQTLGYQLVAVQA
jgi:hypothetical protein